jgi:hypothetical protein
MLESPGRLVEGNKRSVKTEVTFCHSSPGALKNVVITQNKRVVKKHTRKWTNVATYLRLFLGRLLLLFLK